MRYNKVGKISMSNVVKKLLLRKRPAKMAAKNTSKAKMLLCFQTLLDMVKKRAALGLAPPTNEEEWFNTLKKVIISRDYYN